MNVIRRRALLAGVGIAGVGAVVAASLAVATRPGKQVVYTPVAAPDEPKLLGIDRLVAFDPPQAPPAARFLDAQGGEHHLGEFAGRGVVVNLWATWCMPCVAEMPALAQLAEHLAGRGVVVLPLSSDHGGAAAVQAFYAAHAIDGLPVWLDPGGSTAVAFGARGIPTTFVLDRAGRERGRLEGGADWGSEAAAARVLGLVG